MMKATARRGNQLGENASLAAMAAEIDRQLKAVGKVLRRPIESAFAQGNLTGPQRSVMQAVFHSDGIGLKELSRKVGLAHSTVSGIVDRLEQRGMLVRRQDERDGRAVKMEVSAVVRSFMRNKLPELTLHPLVDALRKLTPAERRAIARGLRTLRSALGE